MEKRLVKLEELQIPDKIYQLVAKGVTYDSSSSTAARVYFIDKEQGYFLKQASKGSLEKEVTLTRYFSSKGLAQEVLDYVSDERDWLLTAKVQGEEASSVAYLDNPKRLCQTLAGAMTILHQMEIENCPINNRTKDYLKTVELGYRTGNFNSHYLLPHQQHLDRNGIYQMVQELAPHLESHTLIHGDFCLPNVILHNWKFQALIDWDSAGLGDRHIDLFWAIWSLNNHLKTDRYRQYFLDCYGREMINLELLEAIAYFEVFG